jgi:hypothetical protein
VGVGAGGARPPAEEEEEEEEGNREFGYTIESDNVVFMDSHLHNKDDVGKCGDEHNAPASSSSSFESSSPSLVADSLSSSFKYQTINDDLSATKNCSKERHGKVSPAAGASPTLPCPRSMQLCSDERCSSTVQSPFPVPPKLVSVPGTKQAQSFAASVCDNAQQMNRCPVCEQLVSGSIFRFNVHLDRCLSAGTGGGYGGGGSRSGGGGGVGHSDPGAVCGPPVSSSNVLRGIGANCTSVKSDGASSNKRKASVAKVRKKAKSDLEIGDYFHSMDPDGNTRNMRK